MNLPTQKQVLFQKSWYRRGCNKNSRSEYPVRKTFINPSEIGPATLAFYKENCMLATAVQLYRDNAHRNTSQG